MSEYQCKNCGTPMKYKSDGFCSWTCKKDWKEEKGDINQEIVELERSDRERREREER